MFLRVGALDTSDINDKRTVKTLTIYVVFTVRKGLDFQIASNFY